MSDLIGNIIEDAIIGELKKTDAFVAISDSDSYVGRVHVDGFIDVGKIADAIQARLRELRDVRKACA